MKETTLSQKGSHL